MTLHATNRPSVSVYMMAWDAPRAINFMQEVFGADVALRKDRDDGTVMHAEVRIGDSVVMVSDGTPEYPSFPVWLYVHVDDVDATYHTALDYGGISIEEPKNHPEGDRRAGVKDSAGNVWWLGGAVQ